MFFFTATINSWKPLFEEDEMKSIATTSLLWFHQNKRALISGFVIMPNHIHLLWQPVNEFTESANEFALLSFTGHAFKKQLTKNNPALLSEYISTQNDRDYHFWERRPRTIEMMSRKIAEQKLDYIHNNPCQGNWNLAEQPVVYRFSSAKYYETGIDDFGFMTRYTDLI
ncbi:MAG: transposase [Bacteroidia bacterium]